MGKKITIILVAILTIIILIIILAFIKQNFENDFKNCDDMKYKNLGNIAKLTYNGEIIATTDVKIYDERIEVYNGEKYETNITYAHVPLLKVLNKIGAKVEWTKNDIAIITINNLKYTLDLTKKTLVESNTEDDLIIPAPGCETFYCFSVDNDIILDETTVKYILKCMGEPCYINIDSVNFVVNIIPRS